MIGRTIAHYEVLAKIGEGGMGEVYRARDTRLDREVAIKMLPATFAKDPERLARFRREAKLLASLHHTHIAALHGLEESEGEVFLAMELVAGEDLSERLQRGPVDLDDALELARQFAEGLEAAHEQNIVHRDLKPANLKLTPDGKVKILDFGLARAYLGDAGEGDDPDQSPTITAALTAQGVILGTAAYMSPEQARGRRIDQRTDIWAFGAILFEMLSGQRVFTGETISDTMAAVLRADPPWEALPADTPRGVVRLLERCLERDARRRLRDIGEARVRLERWREDPAAMDESYVMGVSAMSGEAPTAGSRRLSPLAIALVVAVLVIGAMGWMLAHSPDGAPSLRELNIHVGQEDPLPVVGNAIAISPGGELIAWKSIDGVHLRDITSQHSRLVEGTADVQSRCFSPDGQWLGICTGGALSRVSIGGGTPVFVAAVSSPRGIAWVDATTIVMTASISEGLKAVNLVDGSVTPLTEIDTAASERSHRWPTTVPGHRAVLFESQMAGQDYDQGEIRWLNLDTGEVKTLQRGGAAPVATAQGQLLFVRDFSIYAAPFDADKGELLGMPVPVRDNVVTSVGNQEDDDGSAQFSLDSQGTLLCMDNEGLGSGLSTLNWVDYESRDMSQIGPAAKYSEMRISPDGTKALISREREGNENIYVFDLETRTETMVTYRESIEYSPTWSPDSKLVYWSQGADSGGSYEVWRRPADGTAPAEFVVSSPSSAGLWPNCISPDGRYLACSVWMGGNLRDLAILDLENVDAGFTPFAPTAADEDVLRWVGQNFVVYRQGRLGLGQLMLRRFPDDGAVWTFPEIDGGYFGGGPVAGGDAVVAFAPSGIYRFSLSLVDGRVQIGPREDVRIWTREEQRRLSGADLHPDGRRSLAYLSEDEAGLGGSPRISIVTGWAQSLQTKLK